VFGIGRGGVLQGREAREPDEAVPDGSLATSGSQGPAPTSGAGGAIATGADAGANGGVSGSSPGVGTSGSPGSTGSSGSPAAAGSGGAVSSAGAASPEPMMPADCPLLPSGMDTGPARPVIVDAQRVIGTLRSLQVAHLDPGPTNGANRHLTHPAHELSSAQALPLAGAVNQETNKSRRPARRR